MGLPTDHRRPKSKRSFHQNDTTLAWWAQLTPRFVPYAKQIRVRWRDPSGQIVQERKARSRDRVYLISRLSLDQSDPSVVGEWRVEALLRGELVDSRLVRVERTRAADESPDL